jgi:dihydrofolate reductase
LQSDRPLKISIIVAMSANNVIGDEGQLPWSLPEDLQHFKAVTMGKPMIMGRATYDAIGRALPGRQSIVLSRQEGFEAESCEVVTSPAAALEAAGDAEEVMIVGGGEIYRLFLPMAHRIYLTRVQAEVNGDTTFPELDLSEWDVSLVAEYPAGDEREFGFDIETLDRR